MNPIYDFRDCALEALGPFFDLLGTDPQTSTCNNNKQESNRPDKNGGYNQRIT